MAVAAYIEKLLPGRISKPIVKQHLAAGIAGAKGIPLWRTMAKEVDRKQDSRVGRGFGQVARLP